MTRHKDHLKRPIFTELFNRPFVPRYKISSISVSCHRQHTSGRIQAIKLKPRARHERNRRPRATADLQNTARQRCGQPPVIRMICAPRIQDIIKRHKPIFAIGQIPLKILHHIQKLKTSSQLKRLLRPPKPMNHPHLIPAHCSKNYFTTFSDPLHLKASP